MRACMKRALSGVVTASWLPATISVGAWTSELLAEIGVAYRSAVGRVALRRGGREHRDDALDLRRFALGEARSEPARHRGVAQVAHGLLAAFQDGIDAGVPDLVAGDLRRGVAQHQPAEPLAGVDAQPLTDQAAHGQPAEMHARQVEGIEQGKHVGAELANGVRSGVTSEAPWPRVS